MYEGLYRLLLVGAATRFRRAASAERAVRRFESARAAVRDLLGSDGLILLPTLGTLAPRHGEMNRLSFRPGVNGVMTPLTLCNYLDLPAVSVPAWRYTDAATGLAPGVMLVARPGGESLLLDTAEQLGDGLGIINKLTLFDWLAEKGVVMMTEVKYEEITDKGLTIITKEGARHTIEADTIVTATPLTPDTELATGLEGKVAEIYPIGDCRTPGLIIDAIADGSRIAHTI